MDDRRPRGEIFNVGSRSGSRSSTSPSASSRRRLRARELVFVPYEEVYGQGIEDMLHRIPAIEQDRRRDRLARRRSTSTTILADVIEHARTRILPVEPRTATAAVPPPDS